MANLLTAIRLLLVIPVAWGFADPGLFPPWVLVVLIAVAIASDYFDGIVARATNTASARGQLFDHGTDFLFVSLGLAGLSMTGLIYPLLPLLIAIAFTQYVFDSYYLSKQKRLRMSFLGRWNGVFYFAPLVIAASARLPRRESDRPPTPFPHIDPGPTRCDWSPPMRSGGYAPSKSRACP